MILGLTGGFGCGKSSVLAFFKASGWYTLSADSVCHDLYNHRNPEVMSALNEHWGSGVFGPDGSINKSRISKIVFSDNSELKWLCSVLYPIIERIAKVFFEQHKGRNIIFEVPLLYEAGWEKMFDKIIAVYASPEVQHQRLLKTGFSLDNIVQRSQLQMTPELKMEKADFTIINNGNIDDLEKQCKELINTFKESHKNG
ncbi:dephospho-CoA kinase [Lentisphaerota bacterium ZTH]|nr:dephospho-CoA kinase [Lentisphaerota bacterium]WET07050.1 dephospho-CoA kinase [Lentisphaerota bacterium ZTH]